MSENQVAVGVISLSPNSPKKILTSWLTPVLPTGLVSIHIAWAKTCDTARRKQPAVRRILRFISAGLAGAFPVPGKQLRLPGMAHTFNQTIQDCKNIATDIGRWPVRGKNGYGKGKYDGGRTAGH